MLTIWLESDDDRRPTRATGVLAIVAIALAGCGGGGGGSGPTGSGADGTDGGSPAIVSPDLDAGGGAHEADATAADSSVANFVPVAIGAGSQHTCALGMDGTVACWGGLLGTDDPLIPERVPGVTGVSKLAVGAFGACVVLGDGTIDCWGDNAFGEIGVDSDADSVLTPTPVIGPTGVVEVTPGQEHVCARESSGRVWCWGRGANGELGTGGEVDSETPVLVTGLSGVVQLGLGNSFSCALLQDTSVSCWGDDLFGTVGSMLPFPDSQVDVPTPIPALSGVRALATGPLSNSMCAVLTDGTVSCWGADESGQIGDPTTTTGVLAPRPVTGLAGVSAAALGSRHACFLLTDETVRCLGDNGQGTLGDGTTTSSATPVTPLGLSGVVQIAAGNQHTCALTSDHQVLCWGDGFHGANGNDTQENNLRPTPVVWR